MFTDAPLSSGNRAGFQQSDQIRTLVLPEDGRSANDCDVDRTGNEDRKDC